VFTESSTGLYGQQASSQKSDLLCFSHLRWDFVYQRPQHLLKRAAKDRRVFFFEEPVFDDGSIKLEISEKPDGVQVVVPHLPGGLSSQIARDTVLKAMLLRMLHNHEINEYVCWYYTPMALSYTCDLTPKAIVYDCMDELSAFRGAPEMLGILEQELFRRSDLVFTGGRSLYESKKQQHHSIYCFPSSIDWEHFKSARTILSDPPDQKEIPNPRLGFFGVVDERFDIDLLNSIAAARPDWHFVIVGPVVKIDPSSLPRRPNIHYLGAKHYQELPHYIAGWKVALLLFALNEATRFISPTKTPEYLAAGKPIVSTPIRDVVKPYGERGLVAIANGPEEFIKAIERALNQDERSEEWLNNVDAFLSLTSWDQTWVEMSELIDATILKKTSVETASRPLLTKQAGSVSA
jgi:UDP-galactopyranose mutase